MRTLTLFKAASVACRFLPMGAMRPLAAGAGRAVVAVGRPGSPLNRLWAASGVSSAGRIALARQWRTVARHQARAQTPPQVSGATFPSVAGGDRFRVSGATDRNVALDEPADGAVGGAIGGGVGGMRLRTAVREAYASYARYWLESLRAPFLTPQAIEAGFSFTGVGHAESALVEGNGIIFALPHLGCWDYAGSWLARAGFRPAAVVEALDPPEVFDWFRQLRQDLGMEVIPADGDVAGRVIGALRANRAVCLPCERDLSGAGVEVTFFGERTTMPAGPAVLALRSGAALLPTAVYYDDDRGGHLGVILTPIDTTRRGRLRDDIIRITQDLADRLEELIRRAPTQWHLFQPNWPSDTLALDTCSAISPPTPGGPAPGEPSSGGPAPGREGSAG